LSILEFCMTKLPGWTSASVLAKSSLRMTATQSRLFRPYAVGSILGACPLAPDWLREHSASRES